MDVVRRFPVPVAVDTPVAEVRRQILVPEGFEGQCRFCSPVIGVAAGAGFSGKRPVKGCFSGICRNRVPGDASDPDIVRLVAAHASVRCGSAEWLVAAQTGCFRFFMSFQELAGAQQEIGQRHGQRSENNGAQDENVQRLQGSPPVLEKDDGKDMQHAEPKQYGNDGHVNGAPFFESLQGDAVPVAGSFGFFVFAVFDARLLFFHFYLFPQFSYEILPYMAACRYRHHACGSRPGKQGVEVDARMHQHHEGSEPSRVAVQPEKKLKRAVPDNLFLAG